MISDAGKPKLLRFQNYRGMMVKQLLQELSLSENHFAVLVNGKKADLDSFVDKDSLVIILPRIAGG